MENKACNGLAAILLICILWETMSPVGKTFTELYTDMLTIAV